MTGAPRLVALLLSGSMVLSACTTVPSATPGGTFAPSSESVARSGETLSQEQLEQLLAPIALYPDALLAQILMASTYPLEVVQAARWSKANPKLDGDAAVKKVEGESWDVSVKSLVAFPNVLEMMNEKLDWTQKLGDAFLAQQKDVAAAIQRLRRQALPGLSALLLPRRDRLVSRLGLRQRPRLGCRLRRCRRNVRRLELGPRRCECQRQPCHQHRPQLHAQ